MTKIKTGLKVTSLDIKQDWGLENRIDLMDSFEIVDGELILKHKINKDCTDSINNCECITLNFTREKVE